MKILLKANTQNTVMLIYLLDYKKNIGFDFDDKLKIGDVRYDNKSQYKWIRSDFFLNHLLTKYKVWKESSISNFTSTIVGVCFTFVIIYF